MTQSKPDFKVHLMFHCQQHLCISLRITNRVVRVAQMFETGRRVHDHPFVEASETPDSTLSGTNFFANSVEIARINLPSSRCLDGFLPNARCHNLLPEVMLLALGRTAAALPAIYRIAVTLMAAPYYCGIALLHGACWFSLVYGIVATRTFRRSSLAAILFLYLWAGVTLIGPKDLAVIRHLSEAVLILGLILMAVNRTSKA